MNRVVGYRLLAIFAIFGLFATAYNIPMLVDHFTPEDTPNDNTEENFAAEMALADSDEQSGEDSEQGETTRDEPILDGQAGDEASLGGFTSILAALILAVMTVGIIGSLGVGVLVSEGVKTGLVLALAGPLLAKLHGSEEDTQTRGRIQGYVEAHPGIYFSALRDALHLANGVTAYHLHRLEKNGEVISWQDGRRRRYAVSGVDAKKLAEVEHPVTGMQRAILEVLAEAGDLGISAVEIRQKLVASKQLMNYHLGQLSERELIRKEGSGRKTLWKLTATSVPPTAESPN